MKHGATASVVKTHLKISAVEGRLRRLLLLGVKNTEPVKGRASITEVKLMAKRRQEAKRDRTMSHRQ